MGNICTGLEKLAVQVKRLADFFEKEKEKKK